VSHSYWQRGVDGRSVQLMKLEVAYDLEIKRAALISHFDVETRGRAIALAPIGLKYGGHLDVSFTKVSKKETEQSEKKSQ
jgi:hypothetical protein